VFDLAARRHLNRGFNDGLTRALEIVLSPVIMGAAGWALDRWLGTEPWFMIVLGTAGVAGVFAKLWIGYDRDMRVEEAKLPQARPAAATPAPAAAPPEVEP
jgi:F0F1-type ATP synthase assembly protein I